MMDCSACSGTGNYVGLYQKYPCDPCDGHGKLDAKTDQKVSKDRMIQVYRKKIKQLQMQVSHYRSQCDTSSKENGHWEEFKEVNGGRQRFD